MHRSPQARQLLRISLVAKSPEDAEATQVQMASILRLRAQVEQLPQVRHRAWQIALLPRGIRQREENPQQGRLIVHLAKPSQTVFQQSRRLPVLLLPKLDP